MINTRPDEIVKRFRGGLVFKAHRLLYHPTLGLREIKKRRRFSGAAGRPPRACWGSREERERERGREGERERVIY